MSFVYSYKAMKTRCVVLLFAALLAFVKSQQGSSDGSDADDPTNPHRNPSKCEVCKIVAIELEDMMEDTGKNREILRLGHQFDKQQKLIPYKYSELRLIEVLEEVCGEVMKYNIHAEREGSRRFAKGISETFTTLGNLESKGVKVELGIPRNMWDQPSAPVHTLKKYCELIIEEYEEAIENWFRGSQKKSLTRYLCAERVLSKRDADCLSEEWTGTERVDHGEKGETDDSTYVDLNQQARVEL